jgi:hypothetical protein
LPFRYFNSSPEVIRLVVLIDVPMNRLAQEPSNAGDFDRLSYTGSAVSAANLLAISRSQPPFVR